MPEGANAHSWPHVCHRCGAELTPGEGSFYVVRIEAFADPTPPPLDDETSLAEISAEMEQLIESMSDLSPQELMDQVYRRLTLLLCRGCYHHWIENPTG
ncbi:MAG: hypothetical protein ACYSU7_01390 [Planctomycetota bacterium]|jgi:hypothetical protein